MKSLIVQGDALLALRAIPTRSVQSCVTSPPYWGLRDYGISGQIGIEPELIVYMRAIRKVFKQVKRILSDDGVLWLNIGDTYSSGNRKWRAPDKRNPHRAMSKDQRPDNPPEIKNKELIGLPWRIALVLQKQGWYWRSDCIWQKPNAQPESVKDRPTNSHEYVMLFSKSEMYWYDADAVAESSNSGGNGLRNLRSVWTIPTQNSPVSHAAPFPAELARICIESSAGEGAIVLDPFMGSGTVGEVCKILGRNFVGIELKPEYCSASLTRLGINHGKLIFATDRQAISKFFAKSSSKAAK